MRTIHIPQCGANYQEGGDFTWMVSDLEELVGLVRGVCAMIKTKWHK